MTDTTTEATGPAPHSYADAVAAEPTAPTGGWVEASAANYPEMPANPHNHIYTVSMDGRGPMLVVRGNTPQEISERYQALLESGATAVAASVYSHLKAEMAVASGVGPVTPVPAPQAPPGAPQPVPLPQAPQAQYPQATQPPNQPYAGQPAWQQAGAPQAPQGPSPEYHNAGWHRLDVPWPQKKQFEAIVAQYGMQKGRPSEGGSYSFNSRGEKAWYVSPQYAGAFSMFNPVPA